MTSAAIRHRMTPVWRTVRRIPAWLALAVTGTGLVVSGTVMDALAADPLPTIVIAGSGDADIVAERTAWSNALIGAEQPTEFAFIEKGSLTARRNLLEGGRDFAISGVPFTEAELAGRPAGAGELIDVPISIASLSVIMTAPSGGQPGWLTSEADPECTNPDECVNIVEPYTGPIRVPPDNLIALMMDLAPSYEQNGLQEWGSEGMQAATADGALTIQQRPGQRHSALNRTEGSAANRYAMEYGKELAPDAWELIKAVYPSYPYEPIGERMSTRQRSRQGFDSQLSNIMKRADAAVYDGNSRPDYWTGNVGVIPTTSVASLAQDYPGIDYRVVEIQNRHGDWVAPTRETLDAALAAGPGNNVGLYEDVPGAYPLVYVNRLYTVAGSLTPYEANALAATIRYIVTDGQQTVIDHGGTTLTAELRAEALAQADRIVELNCATDGFELVAGGAGPAETDTPGVQAIASMLHCNLIPAPPTTTTVAETTTTVEETTTTTVATTESSTTTTAAPTTVATTPPSTASPSVSAGGSGGSSSGSGSSSGGTRSTAPPAPNTTPTATTAAAIVDESTTTTSEPPVEETTTTTTASSVEQAGPTTTVRPRGVALSDLPMQRPSDGSNGPKQLGTLMLGSAMFLGPRKFLMARRADR